MTDPIGRADYELRAPVDPLKKDLAAAAGEIQKTGEATEAEFARRSSKWGPIVAEGFKTGIKLVGAAATGVFAIASKGAIQLEGYMADFQAATGASAEEAKRAGKAINEMSGRNIQGLGEISDTLTKVHTDLGLTGDEAEKTTEQFLRFGRATKQDAGAAVLAFDDILDAWGLTAKDAQGIMDKLIVSHQKYGGSIEANEAALAKLAPALRAANLTYDDGIGLLNLFAASGLDAADAAAAMTKALDKVKSPEELQRLIEDITATEDPLLRLQKATDLFGQKAGAKLAIALAPGKGALKDYKISTEEATDATKKAADALDNTFSARIQLKIKEVGSTIRGLGSDWGPALAGAASLASAFGALGADELVKKLGPKVVAAMAVVGKQGGEALIDAAGTATGAAGTIFGNIIADPIAAALDPERNSLLGRLVRKAGSRIVAVYLAAEIFASTVEQAVAAAWDKVATSSIVMKAAGLAGGKVALAFGAALIVAIPVALANLHGTLSTELEKGYNSSFEESAAKMIASGDTSGILALRAALQHKLDQVAGGVDPMKGLFGGGTDTAAVQRAIDALTAAVGQSAPELRDAWWKEMESVGLQTGPGLAAGVTASAPKAAIRFHNTIQILTAAARKQLAHETRLAGLASGEALAQGILEARQKPLDAFNTLKEMLKHPLTKLAEQTRLLGQLTSKELQKGLHSKDPAIRDQAKATKAYIISRLEELKTGSGKLTKEQAALVNKGLRSKDKDIKAAARAIKSYVQTPLQQLKDSGYSYGVGFTKGFIRGLVADIDRVRANAAAISGIVRKYLQVRSPSELGAFSEMGGPEGWSQHWMSLYTKGLASGIPRINSILGGLAGPGSAGMATAAMALNTGAVAPAATAAVPRGTSGGVTLNGGLHLHNVGSDVSPAAAQRFGRQVLDEVARGFREGGARRGLTVAVRP